MYTRNSFRSGILHILILSGSLSGCATTVYQVRSNNAPRISLEEAKNSFQANFVNYSYTNFGDVKVWPVVRGAKFSDDGSVVVLKLNAETGTGYPPYYSLRLKAMGDCIKVIKSCLGSCVMYINIPASVSGDNIDRWIIWGLMWKEKATQGADALYRLAHSTAEEWAAMRTKEDASFQAVVQSYRAQAVKPELPEEARKYQVKAELAVDEKRVDDAMTLYGQALAIAPWWPEGHFNQAMILADKGEFGDAISEMKRYLVLAPDSPDARAAQDKVYQWEEKAK